jgi:hypothetical protein
MKINFKDLSKEEQEEIKSILKNNGIGAEQVILYKDGNKVIAEIKRTGDRFTLIFD